MKRFFLVIAAALLGLSAGAQVNLGEKLERDPEVRYGKLPNGLVYYVRHNEKPAQRADFYLLTNVGAIQEDPDQDGLAHFLEHMCLNGTKNFPGKAIISYFENQGAHFGRNINAATGVEQTTYQLTGIPTVRQGIVDTALLVMHDYSRFVTNDPKEIDDERGVILEERRTRRTASWRVREKSFEYLFKGSKYATNTLIGTEESLKTFKPESLVRFYDDWYHPGNQAVLVVGDIDPDYVVAKLAETYSDIPLNEHPRQKELYYIPDNEEPIIGIVTDPELNATGTTLYIKRKPRPDVMNSILAGQYDNLVRGFIGTIFSERLSEIALKSDAPFLSADVGIGKLCNTCEVLTVSASSKEGCAVSAFTAAMTEVERAKRYGFTQAEFDRAKTNYLTAYEERAASAADRLNSQFISGLQSDFFNQSTFVTPAYRLEKVKTCLDILTLQAVNEALKMFDWDRNAVILYQAPEKEGLTHPTEAELAAVLTSVKEAEIENTNKEEQQKELMDASVLKGSKVKKAKDGKFDSQVWTLKNGIQVIVRPSDLKKEEVLMNLIVDGGKSLVATEDLPSIDANFLQYLKMNGVAEFSAIELSKMLAGNTASASPYIRNLNNGFSCGCTPKDLERMFQLMYLKAVNPRFNEEEFAPLMNQIKAVLPNLVARPSAVFSRKLLEQAYDNPRLQPTTMELVDQFSFETLERVYRELFGNFKGAKVFIVGNVDPETLKPLVEKYIGSLPVGKKAHKWVDWNLEAKPGMIDHVFTQKMETPKSTVYYSFNGDAEYSLENGYTVDFFKSILDMVYTDTIREKEGGTYGVSTSGSLSIQPKKRTGMTIQFDTDPDKVETLSVMVLDELNKLAADGIPEEYFQKAKLNFLKGIPEMRISNSYWMSMLEMYYRYGVDQDSTREAVIEGITPEKVQSFINGLLSQGNRIKLIMNPEQ